MKTTLPVAAIALAALLSGCVEYQWQKYGATQDDFNRDRYQCQMEAARTFPTALTAVQVSPGYQGPSQTYCNGTNTAYGMGDTVYGNSNMNCTTTPGMQVAPVTTTVDANANNRAQAANSCMFARGYRLVEVKR